MTDYPITPPPELITEWINNYFDCSVISELSDLETAIATQAVQWGADQELEACCEWLIAWDTCEGEKLASFLREGRRPKPPSLKEQGLQALEALQQRTTDPSIVEPLRRALEALPND